MRNSGNLYRLVVWAFVTTVLTALAGCGASGDSAQGSGRKVESTAPPVTQSMGESTSEGGTVINDPSQAQPGGSYRIKPANPDDPKYKAAPGIGGGN